MKTLNTIQTISKIAKIICKIGYVCCIVGGILGVVGFLSLVFIPDGFKLGGVTIQGMIEKSPDVSVKSVLANVAAGVIMCIGYGILLKIAVRYFKNELDAGTPFTFDGAKELLRLGIYTICIPIATMIASKIVFEVMKRLIEADIPDPTDDIRLSAGVGIALIIMSVLCRYGAEIIQQREKKEDEKTDENTGV